MSTPTETPPLSVWGLNQQIQPGIITEKKRPKTVKVSAAGFPYYPDRQVILPGTPTLIQLDAISRQILIQNNSGGILYRKYRGDVSSTSLQIASGQSILDAVSADCLYLFSVAGAFINPYATDGNGVIVEVYP